MSDALRDVLRRCDNALYEAGYSSDSKLRVALHAQLDALSAPDALRSGDEWTRVEDGLPKCGETKDENLGWQVYRPKAQHKIESCYSHPSWWASEKGILREITHWRPLPPAPEDR